MKTGPFLDRAGMQEGGRPVAVVDELHKRLEEQLVKCGRQRASGFSGHPRPDSGRGAMPGSGEKPLRHWAEQKRGRRPGRDCGLPGRRCRHGYPRCIHATARGDPCLTDAAQGGWAPGPKHPEDWGWGLSLRCALP